MQRVDRWHNFHIEPILFLLFWSLEIISSVAPSGVPTWWIIQARQWRLRWSWCWQSWPRSLIAESCLQVLSFECWVRSALYMGCHHVKPRVLNEAYWVLAAIAKSRVIDFEWWILNADHFWTGQREKSLCYFSTVYNKNLQSGWWWCIFYNRD